MLNEGDCVTFGHKSGQTIKPGTHVRQPESEYQFVVSFSLLLLGLYDECAKMSSMFFGLLPYGRFMTKLFCQLIMSSASLFGVT